MHARYFGLQHEPTTGAIKKKKKNEDRYKINVTYARFEYMANR